MKKEKYLTKRKCFNRMTLVLAKLFDESISQSPFLRKKNWI